MGTLGDLIIGAVGIVVGVVGALVGVIYHNSTARQDRHEEEDDKRFEQMIHMFDERHRENQDSLRKITRVLMMIVTATVSNDAEAKRELVGAIKELII